MPLVDPDEKAAQFAEIFPWTGPPSAQIVAGVGADDCAIFRIKPSILVVTSDYVNASPISLQLGLATYSDLGNYLVGSNISDLCGSGAQPIGLMINIVWPNAGTDADFTLLLQGIQEACVDYGVGVLGGDTKLGPKLILNATAIGSATSEAQLSLQSNALVGDDIWASGPMGSCAAAALGLTKYQLDSNWQEWARGRILRPRAPVELVAQTSQHMLSAGGADVSDGLGSDLLTICRASKVGAQIVLDAVPYEAPVAALARVCGLHPARFAFTVGGDLQYVLTARLDHRDLLEDLGYTWIGNVTAASLTLVTGHGSGPLPVDGHRDARGLTFPDEIEHLLSIQGTM